MEDTPKIKLVFISLLMLLLCFKSSLAGPHGDHPWCYKDPHCDSKSWAGLCKQGKTQSPVDFGTESLKENRTEIRIRFNKAYMDVQEKFYIKNNGHTVQLQLTEDLSSKLLMDGDGMKGSYVFSQLHFHWGSVDDKGSEHTVNGTSFPMEMHFVHYNEIYKGLGEAVGSKNHRALAVLGIFFEISPTDNPALKPIVDSLADVQNVQDKPNTMTKALNVSSFFPNDMSLYRYYGSLTTPACFEIVHWNVLRKAIPVSKHQLEAFRNLKDSHGEYLVDNYRPTLPLAGRKVTQYDEVEFDIIPDSSSDHHKPLPDTDYEEALNNVLEPKNSSGDKNKEHTNNAGLPTINSISLGLSCIVTICMRLKY